MGYRFVAAESDCWLDPVAVQIFTFSQKASANFQLIVRLLQGIVFLAVVTGVSVAVVLTPLTIGDVFASALAIIPTGWGLLSVSIYIYNTTPRESSMHSLTSFFYCRSPLQFAPLSSGLGYGNRYVGLLDSMTQPWEWYCSFLSLSFRGFPSSLRFKRVLSSIKLSVVVWRFLSCWPEIILMLRYNSSSFHWRLCKWVVVDIPYRILHLQATQILLHVDWDLKKYNGLSSW